MPAVARDQPGPPAGDSRADILIVYRTGGAFEIDQRNIAVISRVIAKATRPIGAEIFYHLPARLSDWAQPSDGVRYTRLKTGEIWPLAERITKYAGKTIVIFDATLLIASRDVWHLIGYAQQHARVLLQPRLPARSPFETHLAFALREARLHLQRTIWGRVSDASAMSLVTAAFEQRGVRAQISYAELLESGAEADVFAFEGGSRAISARTRPRYLETCARTITAFRRWQSSKAFAASYSQLTPVFHVAQIAVYLATLIAFVSPQSGAIILGFAIAVTPMYFFGNLNLRQPIQVLRRLAARLLLYYIG